MTSTHRLVKRAAFLVSLCGVAAACVSRQASAEGAAVPSAEKTVQIGSGKQVTVIQELYSPVQQPLFRLFPGFLFKPVGDNNGVAVAKAETTEVSLVRMSLGLRYPASDTYDRVAEKLAPLYANGVDASQISALPLVGAWLSPADSLHTQKYGLQRIQVAKSPPANIEKLDVEFRVKRSLADELVERLDKGEIALDLEFTYKKLSVDQYRLSITAERVKQVLADANLWQQGADFMSFSQDGRLQAALRSSFAVTEIEGLGRVEDPSFDVEKLIQLFDVANDQSLQTSALQELDQRLANQLSAPNPADFQPFQVQREVLDIMNRDTDTREKQTEYRSKSRQGGSRYGASASGTLFFEGGVINPSLSGSYTNDVKKVDGTMGEREFNDFVSKYHSVYKPNDPNFKWRGVSVFDRRRFDALAQTEVSVSRFKPLSAVGRHHITIRPSRAQALEDFPFSFKQRPAEWLPVIKNPRGGRPVGPEILDARYTDRGPLLLVGYRISGNNDPPETARFVVANARDGRVVRRHDSLLWPHRSQLSSSGRHVSTICGAQPHGSECVMWDLVKGTREWKKTIPGRPHEGRPKVSLRSRCVSLLYHTAARPGLVVGTGPLIHNAYLQDLETGSAILDQMVLSLLPNRAPTMSHAHAYHAFFDRCVTLGSRTKLLLAGPAGVYFVDTDDSGRSKTLSPPTTKDCWADVILSADATTAVVVYGRRPAMGRSGRNVLDVIVIDAKNARVVRRLDFGTVNGFFPNTISADGRWLIASDYHGSGPLQICQWDTTTGDRKVLAVPGVKEGFFHLALSAQGHEAFGITDWTLPECRICFFRLPKDS